MTPLSLSGLWGAQSPTGGATTAQTHTVHHIWYPENIELRGQWGQRLYTRSNDSKPTKSRFTLSKTPNLWWWYASFQNECLNTKDSLLFILTYNHLAEGDVIFKINVQGGDLIIKLSTNIRYLLKLAHICLLIIDSRLYRERNATQISEYFSTDGMKPWLSFDRLSHFIMALKHREEGMGGGGRRWGERLPTPQPQKVFLCQTFSKHSILKISFLNIFSGYSGIAKD